MQISKSFTHSILSVSMAKCRAHEYPDGVRIAVRKLSVERPIQILISHRADQHQCPSCSEACRRRTWGSCGLTRSVQSRFCLIICRSGFWRAVSVVLEGKEVKKMLQSSCKVEEMIWLIIQYFTWCSLSLSPCLCVCEHFTRSLGVLSIHIQEKVHTVKDPHKVLMQPVIHSQPRSVQRKQNPPPSTMWFSYRWNKPNVISDN